MSVLQLRCVFVWAQVALADVDRLVAPACRRRLCVLVAIFIVPVITRVEHVHVYGALEALALPHTLASWPTCASLNTRVHMVVTTE